MKSLCEEDSAQSSLMKYVKQCREIARDIQNFNAQTFDNYIYWIDREGTDKESPIGLHAHPLSVAPLLQNHLFKKTRPVILTSATLTIQKSFTFVREQIGLTSSEELCLGSSYNYTSQCLLYIADDLPDPYRKQDEFKHQVQKRILEIIKITHGHAFILCTSWNFLNLTYDYLTKNCDGTRVMKQERGSSLDVLIEEFKQTQEAVLLGVYSLWEGVDVIGPALRCIIIAKLPFSVPSNPVVEAMSERFRKKGMDAFHYYQIPEATIKLKQGFGRLIRSKRDWGVVAILDSRLATKNYGKRFLRSLPKCRVTNQLQEVEKFFRTHETP